MRSSIQKHLFAHQHNNLISIIIGFAKSLSIVYCLISIVLAIEAPLTGAVPGSNFPIRILIGQILNRFA